jgi:hypothetical protein
VSVSFRFDGLLDAPPLLDELDEVPSPFDPLGVPGPSGLLEGLVLSALDGDVVPGPSCGFADDGDILLSGECALDRLVCSFGA